MINIGLVTLPLDSGPKLAVGQWIACWSGLPGGSSSRWKHCMSPYQICLIYRTWKSIHIGSGRFWNYLMWREGKPKRDGTIFMRESWPLKKPCKDFNLAIVGELGWMKWLKNEAAKCLYLMQLFLNYILFDENFIA